MRWLPVILVFCAVLSSGAAAKNFRWCTVNPDEVKKCDEFIKALPVIAKLAGVNITSKCVSGSGEEDCMKKIKNNEADFITLDGGKIYQAGKCYDLVPVVAEDYGPPEGISYYAVAVARNDTDIDLGHLKEKKSCHTGYRRTAGWNMPVGYLMQAGQMEKKGSDAKSASAFFSKSCVPGIPKDYPNLCKLCQENCFTNSEHNKYGGYTGAFKCMADNKGDVAFVKHLTTGEVVKAGGYGNMSDYKYLCTDGSFKVVTSTSHENCNLGSNPSHAVVTRKDPDKDCVKVLLQASMYCQSNTSASKCNGFMIFNSKMYGSKANLLFKDSTKKLVDVEKKNTYEAWLGNGYTKAIKALGSISCTMDPPGSGTTTLNPLPAILAVLVVVIKALA